MVQGVFFFKTVTFNVKLSFCIQKFLCGVCTGFSRRSRIWKSSA